MIRMEDLVVPYYADPLVGAPNLTPQSPQSSAFSYHVIPAQYNQEQEREQ